MAIRLIGGEKGGTGKTTIATSLVAARAAAGRDVVLVDTDPQGSGAYWAALRDRDDQVARVACVRLHGRGIGRQLQDTAQRYEDVIVDAGGRDSVELRAAMTVAQQLIAPIQASQFDTWTLEALSDLVEQARAINDELVACVCINRASPNPRVGEAAEARELLAEYANLDLMTATLRDRIAYRRAARGGLGVTELSEDAKAAAEIRALYEEIYDGEQVQQSPVVPTPADA